MTMQEPILVPGPQLHESKDQNSNQDSNEKANQNSNKKETKRPRKNPTLVQAQNCNQDSAQKRTKTTRNTATKAARKTGITMTTPTLVPATTTPLSWIKPLSWAPKWGQKSVPKTSALSKIPVPAMWCEGNEPTHKHPTRGWNFSASGCNNKWAMWTSKWGLKSGHRFGGREKKKQFGGPQNGVRFCTPF